MLSVRVVELLVLDVWLLSLSNYNLFSKFKAFGDFSESLFACRNGGDESKRCHYPLYLKYSKMIKCVILRIRYTINVLKP